MTMMMMMKSRYREFDSWQLHFQAVTFDRLFALRRRVPLPLRIMMVFAKETNRQIALRIAQNCSTDLRKLFFSRRMVSDRNAFSNCYTDSSVAVFTINLDNCWKGADIGI